MATKTKKTDHIGFRNSGLFCHHCGAKQPLKYPMAFDQFQEIGNAFTEKHKDCKKTWEPPQPDLALPQELRELWWVSGEGEQGTSSLVIFLHLSDPRHRHKAFECGLDAKLTKQHPHDPDDLRRCYLLLEAIPEWKPRLQELKSLSPVWAALIDKWEDFMVLLKQQIAGVENDLLTQMKAMGC